MVYALLFLLLHGTPTAVESGIPSIHRVELGVSMSEVEHLCGKPASVEKNQKAPWGRWIYQWGSIFFDEAGKVDEIRGLPLHLSGKSSAAVTDGMSMAKVASSFVGKKRRTITELDVQYQLGRQTVQVGYDEKQRVQICRIIRDK